MAWTDWDKLNRTGIANARIKAAVYRLAVGKGYCFSLLLNRKVKKWVLATYSEGAIFTAFSKSGLSRVLIRTNPPMVITDLIYIGRSEFLKRRLKEHYEGTGNEGIRRAHNYGLPIYFSYYELKTEEACEKAELALLSKFVERAQGLCPPFDNNSPECSACKGEAVKAYMKVEGKMRLLC